MLSNKQKMWVPYIGILSVLLILLVYSQYRQRRYEVRIEPVFAFKPDDVTSFTIWKDNLSVTIAKQDSVWIFAAPDTGQPAKYKIEAFFKDVVKGEREGFISDDTSTYSKYGVSDAKAVRVDLRNGDETHSSVFLGQSVSDYNQEYIRYSNNPKVYPARQSMINKLSGAASWWR